MGLTKEEFKKKFLRDKAKKKRNAQMGVEQYFIEKSRKEQYRQARIKQVKRGKRK